MDSDHMPVIVEMEMEEDGQQEEKGEREKKKEEERWTIIWNKESIQNYKEATNETNEQIRQEDETVEGKWSRIKEIVHGAMVKKKIKYKVKGLGHKDWWDKSCTRKKRETHRAYGRWRKGKAKKEEYMEERRKMKEWLLKKQKERREEEEAELRKMKEAEIWKYINKKRGKKVWRENNIGEEDWRVHFMGLLGGEETREGWRGERRRETREEEEEDLVIGEGEIGRAVRKMKMKKAAGIDRIYIE